MPSNHYSKKAYLSQSRLLSYLEQWKYVNDGDAVLEVGGGAGLFGDMVRKIGTYKSTDIDVENSPDYCCDISDTSACEVLPKQTDVVHCCQVLEHMPFEQTRLALGNVFRLEAKQVVISIPDNRRYIEVRVKIPKLYFHRFIEIPKSGREVNITNNHEHHWEVGCDRTEEILNVFRSPPVPYRLVKEYRCVGRPKNRFFIYQRGL